jgi:hypothetical protein
MVLRNKTQMVIPLCQMILMLVVHPILKIYVFKMEHEFQTNN